MIAVFEVAVGLIQTPFNSLSLNGTDDAIAPFACSIDKVEYFCTFLGLNLALFKK